MSSRGQGLAFGLRPQFRADLLHCHNERAEGVAIVLDDARQLSFKSDGLFIIEFKVHTSNIVPLTDEREPG